MQFAVTGSSTFAFTGLLNNVVTLCAESFLLVLIVGSLMFVDPVVALFALVYFGVFVVVVQLLINASLKRSGQEAVEGTATLLTPSARSRCRASSAPSSSASACGDGRSHTPAPS